VEEKKPAAQQQKVVKTENVPQQKNAWGNVKVGQKAEVKPGTVKNSSAPSQLVQKADSNEGMDHLQPPQQDWERGAMENDVQNQEGGDAEGVVRARRMLDDFLKTRGMQQGGQDGDENDPWSSENAHQVTEDSNDTDEVFFMRPNGVVMLAAPGEKPKNTHAPTGWEAGGNPQRVSPMKPSAWALGAPRIVDRDPDEGLGSSFVQGFGQVDGPAGLMAFELSCDGGDAFSSAGGNIAPAASGWGNPALQVNTTDEGDGDENGQEDNGEKSPSVALKMLLGIGMGGAALPGAPAAPPPAARKLPVWGKPDGQVDISMDPAIAQIATDMPPPARGTPYQQHAQEVERERAAFAAIRNQQKAEEMARKAAGGMPAAPDVNRSVFDSEHDKSGGKGPVGVGRSWDSTAKAPSANPENHAFMGPPAPGPKANLALAQNIQHKHSGLSKHLGQMETPSSLMQSVPQMQGFGQSGSAQEQGWGMGGNMVRMPPMPTPQQLQQMQPPDFLRSMQDAGDPSWGPNVPVAHDAQVAPSERPPDSVFPFSMGAGMPRSGGGLGGFASMPPMPPVQGIQNTFGMGGLGIMASHAGPCDNSNLPPWMQQQQQAPQMGMGNMGNMGLPPNAGHPGDNIGLPPWMRQHQGPPMGMGPQGGFGNGVPPGMGMGPMGPTGTMGPGGGLDLLKMLGSQGGPPHMGVGMGARMGGQGAGEPNDQPGFGFPAEQASGAHATGAQAGGDGGSGRFDFNKVFGGMKSAGHGGMPQLPRMSGPGPMPGTMLSLAGMLPSSAFS
jgi:hypothetical protein